MLIFGGQVSGFHLLNYFSRNGDNLLLGKVWGPNALGFYSRAYSLSVVPITQIIGPLSAVAMPTLSRLQSDPDRYRRYYLGMLDKVLLVTVPISVLCVLAPDWLILVILGNQWHEATPVFAWLAVSAVFQSIASTTGWLFFSQGRSRELLMWGAISCPIILGSFFLGLRWGPVGVAAAYSLTLILLITPLLFSIVGGRGPVGTRHLYQKLILALKQAFPLVVALGLLRWAAPPWKPVHGFFAGLALTAVVWGLVVAVTPEGRRSLRELLDAIRGTVGKSGLEATGMVPGK